MFKQLFIFVAMLNVLIILMGCTTTQLAPSIDMATDTPIPPTPIPPTATPTTPTATLVPPTETNTSLPTETATPLPTNSPTPVPTLTVTPLPPLKGSGGGVIAFFSDRDGNNEIYVMNADGSNQRNLTNNPFSDTDPAWSPDGSQIAFASTRDGNYEIYVMDSDGSNIRRLTNHIAIDVNPTWSPDGSQIAFLSRRYGNVEIFLINVDGSNLQRITHNNYDDFEIDWSPDGKLMALASQVGEFANIYTINVESALQGTPALNQLTDTEAHDGFPKWSPDSSQIAFISNREGSENWEVFIMKSDGSNQRRLTYSDGLDGIPTWSPDSTQIAFESNRDGDNDIYVLKVAEALRNPEEVEILRLTDNDVNDQQPVWRPEQSQGEPTLSIDVPGGTAPDIDGRLSDGEWDGARVTPLTGGGELHLMHADGYIFLGIRANAPVLGSICVDRESEVSVFHASASLGTAVYRNTGDEWQLTQPFAWSFPESHAEEDKFLSREGWLANTVFVGDREEMEFQIANPTDSLRLAVAYLVEPDWNTVIWWPLELDDDCRYIPLLQGDAPVKLQFNLEQWGTVRLSSPTESD